MTDDDIQARVVKLTVEIVRRYMPNEVAVFELKRKRGGLISTSPPQTSDDRARDLTSDFGPSEKIALECVPLLLGSIKAAVELLKALRDGRRTPPTLKIDEVQKKWHDDLVKAGLSSKRASQITTTFAADLMGLLK
jgi:hypothetical protein